MVEYERDVAEEKAVDDALDLRIKQLEALHTHANSISRVRVKLGTMTRDALEAQELGQQMEIAGLRSDRAQRRRNIPKPRDTWKERQQLIAEQDSIEQARYEAEMRSVRLPGEPAPRRRRIAHAGLFDAVDYCKSQIPHRSKPSEALRHSMRELLVRYMQKRDWRAADIARWVDTAVELALTPSTDEIEALKCAHASSTRSRNAQSKELRGGVSQC